ncbi:MAG: hypothetical protein QME05_03095 [Candidatus Margulisbacteria bacterium]|nr:hypothetical protein [Candidatus Margulisiibacteriota bacterium]
MIISVTDTNTYDRQYNGNGGQNVRIHNYLFLQKYMYNAIKAKLVTIAAK